MTKALFPWALGSCANVEDHRVLESFVAFTGKGTLLALAIESYASQISQGLRGITINCAVTIHVLAGCAPLSLFPINFWWNSTPFSCKEHFSSSNIE